MTGKIENFKDRSRLEIMKWGGFVPHFCMFINKAKNIKRNKLLCLLGGITGPVLDSINWTFSVPTSIMSCLALHSSDAQKYSLKPHSPTPFFQHKLILSSYNLKNLL